MKFAPAGCLLLFFFVLASCGIEDYPYLEQIPPGNVTRSNPAVASVAVPARDNFLHYSIFYRIYISETVLTSAIGESELNSINATLQSDFNTIKPYTDSSNNLAANTGSLFSGRNYFEIEITEGNINDLLLEEKSAFTLVFDFSDTNSQAPRIRRQNGGDFTLKRSTGSGLFNPQPRYVSGQFDGRFVNTQALNSSENTAATINRDTANKTISAGTPRYTYASLYICAVGINNASLAPVYSAPTSIGVFRLPEKWWQGDE